MLRFFPVPMLIPAPCSSSGPGQRPGTRMTINEDAAQESERRLVDSYLRLGEISHLALQRDTITKHY